MYESWKHVVHLFLNIRFVSVHVCERMVCRDVSCFFFFFWRVHSVMNQDVHENISINPFNARVTKSQNMHYFAKFQNQWGLGILMSGTKVMNTCSFTTHSSVCFKICVECIICYDGLEAASSFPLHMTPLNLEVFYVHSSIRQSHLTLFEYPSLFLPSPLLLLYLGATPTNYINYIMWCAPHCLQKNV